MPVFLATATAAAYAAGDSTAAVAGGRSTHTAGHYSDGPVATILVSQSTTTSGGGSHAQAWRDQT